MAAGKQYKNVYTILEKVKKGEIDSYYKSDEGLFGKINFYKKPDLVKPHMHYIDERRLESILDSHLLDNNQIKAEYDKFAKSTEFKKLADDQKPDFGKFVEKFKDTYRNFPKHMGRDIFKMYYDKMDNLEFEERNDKNYTKYKFLERANNPVGKIMSENSNLKSAIYARNIVSYFINRLTAMEYVDAQKAQDIKNGMDGGSDFDNDGVDKALDKMLDGKQAKDQLNKAMDEAQDLCKQMDQNVGKDIQEKMFENANKGAGADEAGKISPDYIRKISAKLEKVNLSMGAFKDKIKKLLDKSVSYFSAQTKTTYEDLFNSDNVAGLDEYELLHPNLRKVFIEDINIKETKNIGKIDVYLDISGSMSSSCSSDSDLRHITKMDFSKSLTAKLKQMDMLNNVYLFDTRVKECGNDIVSIAMIDCGGGTTINEALRKIEKNGVNALVITDAEDHCSIYSDKAFFIGVEGACFSSFSPDVIEQYSNKGQVIIFDGKKIIKVNSQGYEI